MVTGRQAFSGNTSAAVFDGILNRAPVPPLELNPQLPPKIAEILDKALEKDIKLRYQTASDFRVDLQRLRRESDSHASSNSAANVARAAAVATAPAVAFKRWPLLAAVSAVLAIALIATAYPGQT